MAADIPHSDVIISLGVKKTVARIKHLLPAQIKLALAREKVFFDVEEEEYVGDDTPVVDEHKGNLCPNDFNIHYICCLGCLDKNVAPIPKNNGTYVNLRESTPKNDRGDKTNLFNLLKLSNMRKKEWRERERKKFNEWHKIGDEIRNVRFAGEA